MLPAITSKATALAKFQEQWLTQQLNNINHYPANGVENYSVHVEPNSVVPIDQLITLVGSERSVIDDRVDGVGAVIFSIRESV